MTKDRIREASTAVARAGEEPGSKREPGPYMALGIRFTEQPCDISIDLHCRRQSEVAELAVAETDDERAENPTVDGVSRRDEY